MAERGFTLIELVVTIAIVALASLATLGLIAAIVKNGAPNLNRDLALMIAQNTLERARVAAAYLPLVSDPSQDAAAKTRAASGDTSYILTAASSFSAAAKLPDSTCAASGAGVARLALEVTTSLSGANVFSVSVRYPVNACSPGATASVDLTEVLPAPIPIPGTRVFQPLYGEPSVQ
ncbi:MAG: hypothetical protein NVSMB64_22540 [Candidatus Velthaea sp.]